MAPLSSHKVGLDLDELQAATINARLQELPVCGMVVCNLPLRTRLRADVTMICTEIAFSFSRV